MSNTSVDFEKVDYSHGKQCMNQLYDERNVVGKTWADFLALPKIEGYLNNINRVPNDFCEKVTDKKEDKYTTLSDCLEPKIIE